MKVFIVIENFDSGPGYASYNIDKIFLSEQKAIDRKNELIKRYEELCNVKYEELPVYEQPFEVISWEVEE